MKRYCICCILGFQSYVGLLTVENAQTNPVMIVFVSLLSDAAREKDSYVPELKSIKKSDSNQIQLTNSNVTLSKTTVQSKDQIVC